MKKFQQKIYSSPSTGEDRGGGEVKEGEDSDEGEKRILLFIPPPFEGEDEGGGGY